MWGVVTTPIVSWVTSDEYSIGVELLLCLFHQTRCVALSLVLG